MPLAAWRAHSNAVQLDAQFAVNLHDSVASFERSREEQRHGGMQVDRVVPMTAPNGVQVALLLGAGALRPRSRPPCAVFVLHSEARRCR